MIHTVETVIIMSSALLYKGISKGNRKKVVISLTSNMTPLVAFAHLECMNVKWEEASTQDVVVYSQ